MVIDRIDIEFRKNILSWITGIENAYKTYFNRIRIADDGHDVGAESNIRMGSQET